MNMTKNLSQQSLVLSFYLVGGMEKSAGTVRFCQPSPMTGVVPLKHKKCKKSLFALASHG